MKMNYRLYLGEIVGLLSTSDAKKEVGMLIGAAKILNMTENLSKTVALLLCLKYRHAQLDHCKYAILNSMENQLMAPESVLDVGEKLCKYPGF